jgi:ankyrin repeat protein
MATVQHDPELVQSVVLNAHGNFAKVRELIEQDPSLLNVNAPWTETPIQAASHMGNRQIAEWLIESGAPVDVFTAIMLGRRDEVERFLDAEPALVRARGVHDMPILLFAAVGNQPEIAALLVERGADLNAGAGGNTALHGAAFANRPEMIGWLLEHGADSSALNYEGKTAMQVANEAGFTAVADALGR